MTILSTIMGVESGGGHNLMQGNIGDINNQRAATGGSYQLAQGYMQITGPTWSQFGGLSTGYTSPIAAPYATQIQVAQNIPVSRWGPNAQSALQSAGYQPMPGETLGQMMTRYGESPAATTAADGSTMTGNPVRLAGGPATDPNGTPVTDPTNTTGPTYNPMGDATGGNATYNVDPGTNTAASAAGDVPGYLPPSESGGPAAFGLIPGLSTAVGGWLTGAEKTISGIAGTVTTSIESSVGTWMTQQVSSFASAIGNWFARWGLVMVALILLIIAVWRLSEGSIDKVAATAGKIAPLVA